MNPDYANAAYNAEEAQGLAIEITDATRRMEGRLPEDAAPEVLAAAEKASELASQLRGAMDALVEMLGKPVK